MDDNDLLYSNSYNPAKESQGYGLTDELKRFKLRDHIEKQQTQTQTQTQNKMPVDDKMFVNDLLNTNRVVNEKGEANPINSRTIFKEVRYVYSINSNQRSQFSTRPFDNPTAYESIFSKTGYKLFKSIYDFYDTYLGFIGLTSEDADFLIYKSNLSPLYTDIVSKNARIFYNRIGTQLDTSLPFNTFIVSNGVGIITFPTQDFPPFEIESLITLNMMPLFGTLDINNRPFTVLNCSMTFVEFDFYVSDEYPDYEYIAGDQPSITKFYKTTSLTDYSKNERFLVENQFTMLLTFEEIFNFVTNTDDNTTIAKVEDLSIIAQWLNVLASTTDIGITRNFWQPFYVYQDVIQEYTYDQTENNYSITLPDYIQNCKSIRLLSTEIPNTLPNVMSKNNVLLLSIARDVRDTDGNATRVTYLPENLKHKRYNFQLIQLDVGQYTVSSILQHMETKLNENLRRNWFNPDDYSDVVEINPEETFFEITFNESTGKINILLNSVDYSFTFHLKFYSNQLNTGSKPAVAVPVLQDPSLDELWYKLGFPWPALVSNSGMDIYKRQLDNCIDTTHALLTDSYPMDDIICNNNFNQSGTFTTSDIVGRDLIKEYNDNRYQMPYRFPTMTRINYIYLALRGFKNIKNIIFDKNNEAYDLFAKVLLNVPPGAIAFDTYVDNPWVFTDVHDTKISKLDFQWVDPEGNPVDFRRVNHSFTLEFITYVSNADVNAYNTKLGIIDKSSFPEYLTGKSRI